MNPTGTVPCARAQSAVAPPSVWRRCCSTGQSPAVKPTSTSGGKLACFIADQGPVTVGTEVTFSGTLSGSNPPYNVNWTFPDATPGFITTTGVPEIRLHASDSCSC